MVKRTIFVKKIEKKEKVRVIEGLENANFSIKMGNSEFSFVEVPKIGESEGFFAESDWEVEGKREVWFENG